MTDNIEGLAKLLEHFEQTSVQVPPFTIQDMYARVNAHIELYTKTPAGYHTGTEDWVTGVREGANLIIDALLARRIYSI